MRYHVATGVYKKFSIVSVTLVLALNSLAATTPLFLSQTAHAAGTTTVVRDSDRQDWSNGVTQTGGTQSFVTDATAPAGNGALQLTTTNNTSSKAQLVKSANVSLADITDLSYYTKQVSGAAEANASFQLTLSGLSGGGTTNLIFETYWNDDSQPTTNNTWQQWDVVNGKFWSSASKGGLTNGSGGPPLYTLADVKALNPNAKVTSFGVNVGTYNLNYVVRVDNLNFNGSVYNFEPEANPLVNGENFNTHSGNDYKGINVGFNIADFGTVSGVTVDLYKDTQKIATNTHNEALLTLINSGTTQLSTPFIIEPGTYTETYWNLGQANWSFGSKPTKAVITVTGTNGTRSAVITPLTEPNGWTYQSVVPLSVPTLLTPTDGAVVNGATLINSWSAVEGATKYEYRSFNGETGNSLRHQETFSSTSKTATNVANNTVFRWQVRALTNGGKQSEWSPLWKVTVDNEVPTTPINGAPHNTFKKTASGWSYAWDASIDNKGPVRYEYQASRNATQSGGILTTDLWNNVFNGDASQNNLTDPSIPSVNTQDGKWYWQVRAIDAAGNKSGWSQIWNVIVDTTAPVINSVTPGADSTVKGTVTFKLNWSDANKSYSYIELNKNGVWKTDNTKDSSPNADELTINTKDYTDGIYGIKVTATDKAGNSVLYTFTFTIDNAKPTISFVTPDNENVLKNGIFPVTVQANDNLNLKRIAVNIYNESNTGSIIRACGSTSGSIPLSILSFAFTCNIAPSDLTDGTYTLRASASDLTDGTAVITRKIRIDNTAPVITPNITNESLLRGIKTIGMDVVEENPKAYNIRVYNQGGSVVQIDGHNVGADDRTVPIANPLGFSLDTTKLADGARYKVVFSAVDQLEQRDEKTVWFIVDNTPPEATINSVVSPVNGKFGGTNNPTVNFTASDQNIESWTLSGNGLSQNGTTSGTFDSIWNVSGLASGTHTATLTAKDKVGNESTISVQITVDNDATINANIENNDVLNGTETITANLGESGTVTLTLRNEDDELVTIDEPITTNISNGTLTLTFDTHQLTNGTYTAIFNATDTLGNAATNAVVTFEVLNTVGGISIEDTPSAVSLAVAPTGPTTPAGLVANQFNTNNPQVLGIATTTSPDDNAQNNGKVKATNTENRGKEIVESTSGSFAWYWILLFIAVAAAAYYAYRNWRLSKDNK